MKSTRGAVAYLAEARVCQLGIEAHSNFLRSSEGGANDCGLFMESELPEMSATDRLFSLQESPASKRNNVVTLEIKDLSPRADGRANIYWSCSITIGQAKTAQVFILTSAAEPDYIAFIPAFYFHDKRTVAYLSTAGNLDAAFWSVRAAWTVHPLPAFPLELSPCMLPLGKIKAALSNFYAFASGDIDCWYVDLWLLDRSLTLRRFNEHTGAIYHVPRPQRFPLSALMPSFEPWQKALKLIHFIYLSFQKHSSIWKLELLPVCPILGDFKLVHLNDGSMIYVEVKECQCKVKYNDKGRICRMQHCQGALGYTERQVFSWKSSWDFMWTTIDGEDQALFLPRDIIPRNWWNAPLPSSEEDMYNLEWPTDKIAMLKKYVVNRAKPSRLAGDMEHILSHTMVSQGSYKARTEIPIEELSIGSSIELSSSEKTNIMEASSISSEIKEHDPYTKQHVWPFSRFRKGFGSADQHQNRGTSYEAFASEAVTELCRPT